MKPLSITEFGLGFGRQDDGALGAFHALDRPPPAGPARAPLPDSTLVVARRGGEPAARATYRVARGLAGAPEVVGVVGHYEARDAEAGVAVLEHAVSALGEAGAGQVVGPMDGTTWDRYRLSLPRTGPGETDPAPFLGEPLNPPEYPEHFEAAGFRPVERYLSRLVPDLDALEERTREAATRLADAGLAFSPFRPERFDDHLAELHALSVEAFAGNAYYSPIGLDAFRAQYSSARSFVDPELVVLARDAAGGLAGFAFSFPDLLEPVGDAAAGRGRVIVKSLAVSPTARGAGLGSLLVHETHRRAASRGYTAVIHALMHEDNPSHRISKHGGDVYRRYALYGRTP